MNFMSNENNRPSTNFFNQSSSNFLSRRSDKTIAEAMYQSMTHVTESEMFDNNALVIFGSQTVRSKNTTSYGKQKSKYQVAGTGTEKIKNQGDLLHTES